jgi:tripartite-type tricarboxylate transporter receptor subunit TctC
MKSAIALCAVVTALQGAVVQAQVYPDHPIRLLVGVPAGAGPDVEARQFASQLALELGQPVVVDNRPGFSQMLALDALAKASPDGYTIAMGQPSNLAANPRLYDRPMFHVQKDLTAVSLVGEHPWVLYVNAASPAKTLAEFIALAKAKPDGITYASTGVGSFQHLTGEWFQKLTGTHLRHVPYGATGWQADLLAGRVDATFFPLITMAEIVKAGKLRALAISAKERSPQLPDVPTFAEANLPEFSARAWFGVMAPVGVSPKIIEKLSTASALATQRPAFREFLSKIGATPVGGSAAEFDRYIKSEQSHWRSVINDASIKLD